MLVRLIRNQLFQSDYTESRASKRSSSRSRSDSGRSSSKRKSKKKSKTTSAVAEHPEEDWDEELTKSLVTSGEIQSLLNSATKLVQKTRPLTEEEAAEEARKAKAYIKLHPNAVGKGAAKTPAPPKVRGYTDPAGPHPSIAAATAMAEHPENVDLNSQSEEAMDQSDPVASGHEASQEGSDVYRGWDVNESLRHEGTGLARVEGTSNLTWFNAEDELHTSLDLETWYNGLFEHHKPEKTGEILTLMVTPKIIRDRIHKVHDMNPKFVKEAKLEEVRYLQDMRCYITAQLCDNAHWYAVTSLPGHMITRDARDVFELHTMYRALDGGDDVGIALRSAMRTWKDDTSPSRNFEKNWKSEKKKLTANAPRLGQTKGTKKETKKVGQPKEGTVEPKVEESTDMNANTEEVLGPPEVLPPPETLPETVTAMDVVPAAKPTQQRRPARLNAIQKRKLEFIANYEGEDLQPLKGGPHVTKQLLQHPPLDCCSLCGDENTEDHKCPASPDSVRDLQRENPYRDIFEIPAESVVFSKHRASVPVSCTYLYCSSTNLRHVVEACPSLHERCGTCRVRGHNDQPHPAFDNRAICPRVRPAGQTEEGLPTYKDLQTEFEDYHGVLTKWRFLGYAGCGFYPARSFRCIKYIVAMGYKALLRSNPEEAIANVDGFFKAAQKIRGLGSQFEPLLDTEILEISRIRDRQKDGPPAKKPRHQWGQYNPHEDQATGANAVRIATKALPGPSGSTPSSSRGLSHQGGPGTQNKRPWKERTGSASSASSYGGPRGIGGGRGRGGGRPSQHSKPPPNDVANLPRPTQRELAEALKELSNLNDAASRAARLKEALKRFALTEN